MRYLILIVLLTFGMLIPLYGQFTQGTKALSGSMDFFTQHHPAANNTTAYKANSFSISPALGLLVSDDLEVGAQVGYLTDHEENSFGTAKSDYKTTSISAGLYVRRYFSITDKFLFSINGDAGYNSGKQTQIQITDIGTSSETKTQVNGFYLDIGPGLVFLPSDHWVLRMGIGNISYSHTKTLSGGGKFSSLDISYKSTGLGVSYYF